MTDLFPTPPDLERYQHFARWMKRCRHDVEAHKAHNEAFWNMINEAGLMMIVPRLHMQRDPRYARKVDEAIARLFGEEDRFQPLTVVQALALCQTADDRRAAFVDLLQAVPSSIWEARSQVAFVLDAADAMGRPLTLHQATALLRAIATPPPAARHLEIMAAADAA